MFVKIFYLILEGVVFTFWDDCLYLYVHHTKPHKIYAANTSQEWVLIMHRVEFKHGKCYTHSIL